ncbi:MAG: hypothetical protein HYV16_05960 [Gammaproteobacteria bacterium]|nr:hypothetical protein [Gammaproteobacteria bacterium]
MFKKSLLLPLLAAALLPGCVVLDDGPRRGHGYGYGPPAHAPAHGYRRQHRGHDMEYDGGLGVYLVIGRPGYYWWDDHYWRLIDGHWHWSVDLYSPWRVVEIDRVPRHLYRRYPDRGREHHDREHHDREHDRYREERDKSHGKPGKDKHEGKSKGKDKGDDR